MTGLSMVNMKLRPVRNWPKPTDRWIRNVLVVRPSLPTTTIRERAAWYSSRTYGLSGLPTFPPGGTEQ